jgi:DNA invertase Pin-like site-specific DNA recombinase
MPIWKGERVGKYVVRRKGRRPLTETDPERCEQAVRMIKDGAERQEVYKQLHIGQYTLNRILAEVGAV